MKTIRPQDVPKQFRDRNVMPVRGYYACREGDVCMASVVGIQAVELAGWDTVDIISRRSPAGAARTTVPMWDVAELDEPYARGLSDGWEDKWADEDFGPDERYQQGHAHGIAAYEACLADGLVVKEFD